MERKFKLQPKQQRKRPQFISPMREPTRKTAETHNISFFTLAELLSFFFLLESGMWCNKFDTVFFIPHFFPTLLLFKVSIESLFRGEIRTLLRFLALSLARYHMRFSLTLKTSSAMYHTTTNTPRDNVRESEMRWKIMNSTLDFSLGAFFFKRWKLLSETAFSERLLNFICDNACTIVSCLSLCATKLRFGESLSRSPLLTVYIYCLRRLKIYYEYITDEPQRWQWSWAVKSLYAREKRQKKKIDHRTIIFRPLPESKSYKIAVYTAYEKNKHWWNHTFKRNGPSSSCDSIFSLLSGRDEALKRSNFTRMTLFSSEFPASPIVTTEQQHNSLFGAKQAQAREWE